MSDCCQIDMELAKLTLNKFLGYTLQLPYYQSYLYRIVRRRRNFHYIGTGTCVAEPFVTFIETFTPLVFVKQINAHGF